MFGHGWSQLVSGSPSRKTPYQNRIKIPSEATIRFRQAALSRWPNLLENSKNRWSRWNKWRQVAFFTRWRSGVQVPARPPLESIAYDAPQGRLVEHLLLWQEIWDQAIMGRLVSRSSACNSEASSVEAHTHKLRYVLEPYQFGALGTISGSGCLSTQHLIWRAQLNVRIVP